MHVSCAVSCVKHSCGGVAWWFIDFAWLLWHACLVPPSCMFLFVNVFVNVCFVVCLCVLRCVLSVSASLGVFRRGRVILVLCCALVLFPCPCHRVVICTLVCVGVRLISTLCGCVCAVLCGPCVRAWSPVRHSVVVFALSLLDCVVCVRERGHESRSTVSVVPCARVVLFLTWSYA